MNKEKRDYYIIEKRCLLILLYMFYKSSIPYEDITLRSFGFSFDPKCSFKAIVKSKKGNIHKYSVFINTSLQGLNLEQMDEMGNINIVFSEKLERREHYLPSASFNIYVTSKQIHALGYTEGVKRDVLLKTVDKESGDSLVYRMLYDKEEGMEDDFASYLLSFYTSHVLTDLVLGAGINADYGAKTWNGLIDSLNNEFCKGDYKYQEEIKSYVGRELFTSPMVMKTSGFDTYELLNKELYLFEEAKTFSDPDSTLYRVVTYIQNHEKTTVITYNYDTNLEYLLKKRGIRYTTSYDDSSFVDKTAKVDIYHVHGLLPYDRYDESRFTDSLIFNESEYYYLYNNPYSWNIAKQLHDFKFRCCILIGTSLTDPDLKRVLELASNNLKFNFIILKKEKDYSAEVFRDLTSYFLSFDLIPIWIDSYEEIGDVLQKI